MDRVTTYTTATRESVFSLSQILEGAEAMRELMQKNIERMAALACHSMFLVHPNNVPALQKAVRADEYVDHVRRHDDRIFLDVSLSAIPIYVSESIPERRVTERWIPPAGDKFVEYGPEDEHWMRPLGLGMVEQIDAGPLIYSMNSNVMDRVENFIFGQGDQ